MKEKEAIRKQIEDLNEEVEFLKLLLLVKFITIYVNINLEINFKEAFLKTKLSPSDLSDVLNRLKCNSDQNGPNQDGQQSKEAKKEPKEKETIKITLIQSESDSSETNQENDDEEEDEEEENSAESTFIAENNSANA
jgi:hypothetical protein